MTGKAIEQGRLRIDHWSPHDFIEDKYGSVDDRPYGGGPGMVMKVTPLRNAILAAKKKLGWHHKVLYLSPQGQLLNQQKLIELSTRNAIIFVAGRYAGIDERVIEQEIDEEYSIGDYVISGGELAAMILIDGVARLIPGVLGDYQSAQQDSFMNNSLSHPHYTRPTQLFDRSVPEVLLSGDHEAIRKWRIKKSLGKTWLRRPDLLAINTLTDEHKVLLEQFITEHRQKIATYE